MQKQCVADDEIATCGTIISITEFLFTTFENGVLMYNCKVVYDIKQILIKPTNV